MISFETEGGVLYKCDDGYNQRNKEIVIPDGVRVIKAHAFDFCYAVRLVIPKSVEVIEEGAFYFMRLTEVENNSAVELPQDAEDLKKSSVMRRSAFAGAAARGL